MPKELKTLKDTAKLAEELVKDLKSGAVLALVGPLGAGKTTLTQELARVLGVKTRVNSPTFVILKVYKTKHRIIKRLVHIDAYRLTRAEDLTAIGWQDYLNDETLVVIEWADKVKKVLPPKTKWLKLILQANGRRTIVF